MTMTRARKIALGLSLAALGLAGAAYAKGADGRGDGVITRAEAQAKAQERFARMDANHDGKLDRADRGARRAAMFDRIDADHNGQISRAEFDAMAQHGRRGHDAGGGEPGMHHGGRGGPGHGGGMMAGRLADANKDGAVTQAEFTAAALQRFDRLDANKDGTVTREERRAGFKASREHRREHRGDHPDAGAPRTPAN